MANPAIKHTDEALAFMTLFKTMPIKVKEEVKEMIDDEVENQEAASFTAISFQSWDEENDLEENKIWEKFYLERKGV